ncbi:MAG: hypothetical protein ABIT09_06695 [Croceibacterium sp.]
MVPAEPIEQRLAQGGPVYFQCEGDKRYQKKGWAVLHLDGRAAGAFGNFKLGVNERWRADGSQALTAAERHAIAEQCRAEEDKRAAETLDRHVSAAAACHERWQAAAPVDPRHAYLVRKGITGEALRQDRHHLLVPMFDASGVLWNIQTIDPAGTKLWQKGARQKGLHLLLGLPDGGLAVAEGYATGAVIRRATGLAVAIAFTWSNLTTTAKAMRKRFPTADIVIGADDDAHLVDHPQIQRNIGLEAAHAAARAVGGRLAVPPRKTA